MFATVILIASLCNVSTVKDDACGGDFEKTWVSNSVQEMKRDANECFSILEAEPDIETVDKDHVITRDCYLPNYDAPESKNGNVVLESMLHPDVKFIYKQSDLEVK